MKRNISGEIWQIFENIVKKTARGVLHIFRIEPSETALDNFMQLVKFGLVGFLNTSITYITYAVLVWLGVYYIIASVIGFILSVLNAVYWNNKHVFKADGSSKRSILVQGNQHSPP
ncbi:MAG: GtrA family protein [Spirochaetales bacterium]|nr:GtrA family protein [Spirochaetales bacterium]